MIPLVLIAMLLSDDTIDLLLDLQERAPVAAIQQSAKDRRAAAAAQLRSIFADHPKQQRFFTKTKAKWKTTRKTRRAGITSGGCREFMARAIEIDGFRATYCAATRIEAEQRAWKSDTKSGLVDILEQFGTQVDHPTVPAYELGGVIVEVRSSELKLSFSNGSEIELFGTENLRSHRKRRGGAKHVFWIDEAQDFFLLEEFFDRVVISVLQDYRGEAWITGTPGVDCVGMFYDITKDVEEGEEPTPGWEVHELGQVDNPFFGKVVQADDGYWIDYHDEENELQRTGPFDAREEADKRAAEVRWEQTAGVVLRKKGWKGTEPDFLREQLGKWVKEDARYVYPVHSVPKHVLVYAEQRLMPNPFVGTHDRFAKHPPWYDHHAAFRDLPRAARGKPPFQWMFAMGVDFGYNPDPFALVVWAFSYETPHIYEMFSWKQTRVHTDDQGAYMKMLWEQLPNVVSFVGDPAGKVDDFEVWQTRMQLPIAPANKQGKNTLEEFLADDIRIGRVHLRKDSPLHTEMKHLVYLPTKPGKTREVHKQRRVNGVIHGDHACDGARYSYSDLQHYLAKAPKDRPPPNSREHYVAEEEREQRAIEDAETRRARAMAEGDELVRGGDHVHGGAYGEDWG